jgi:prepilin-type N-terminal cleavage/methylation domain-containing protein
MRTNIKTKGFTIVELLVVIVVIGILAAITMVSYSGVTTKAKLSANQSNAASVMQAADAFFAEKGYYPQSTELSNGVVKVPSSISISTVAPAGDTEANAVKISYIATAASAATGYCIEYWDSVKGTKTTTPIIAGTATSATCL